MSEFLEDLVADDIMKILPDVVDPDGAHHGPSSRDRTRIGRGRGSDYPNSGGGLVSLAVLPALAPAMALPRAPALGGRARTGGVAAEPVVGGSGDGGDRRP